VSNFNKRMMSLHHLNTRSLDRWAFNYGWPTSVRLFLLNLEFRSNLIVVSCLRQNKNSTSTYLCRNTPFMCPTSYNTTADDYYLTAIRPIFPLLCVGWTRLHLSQNNWS
jgi:hypothetical protein